MPTRPPNERLQPGSWTEAEADALEGKRVRFRKGGYGTVKAAAGMVAGDTVVAFVVQIVPDGWTQPIILDKTDATAGEWAFEIVAND